MSENHPCKSRAYHFVRVRLLGLIQAVEGLLKMLAGRHAPRLLLPAIKAELRWWSR